MNYANFALTAVFSIAISVSAQAEDNRVGPLEGTWENNGFTVTYFAEGFAVPAGKSADKALGVLEATVVNGLVSLRNLTAPNGATRESTQCSMREIGTYEYRIEEDILTLQVVSDPCTDRANSVSSFVMRRVPS